MNFYPHNEPIPSFELQVLRQLHARMELSAGDRKRYSNLEKGYEGQAVFNQLLHNHLTIDHIKLNDLLLKQSNTEFQIDLTLLLQHKIYLFEVKNLIGDYVIKGEEWTTVSGSEVSNPLLQIGRSKSLFRRLLNTISTKFIVEAYVVFVNPEFTLYNASPNLPIILPSQLNRLMRTLNNTPSTIQPLHSNLAKGLVARHLPESSNAKMPSYEYHQVKKGIICLKCSSFMHPYDSRDIVCNECGTKENINSAILRSAKEFSLLFPEIKITTSTIFEWCKIVDYKERVKRVLGKHLFLVKNGRYSYYVFPTDRNEI